MIFSGGLVWYFDPWILKGLEKFMFLCKEIMISVLKDVSNVKLKSKTRVISIFNMSGIFITSFNVRSRYIVKPNISVQPYFQYFLLENNLPNILNFEKIQFENLA